MTWNCHGMDLAKQALLASYVTTKSIKIVFLQEGDSGFTNPMSETTGDGVYSSILFDRASKAVELVAAISSSSFAIAPASGVSRAGYYNITGSLAFTRVLDVTCVDYLSNEAILKWVLLPAQACVDGKRIDKKKLSVRRGSLEGGGDKNFKAKVEEEVLQPVQRRLNVLGHRRPKAVDVAYGTSTLRIYYWHAPLGTETKLSQVGSRFLQHDRGRRLQWRDGDSCKPPLCQASGDHRRFSGQHNPCRRSQHHSRRSERDLQNQQGLIERGSLVSCDRTQFLASHNGTQ